MIIGDFVVTARVHPVETWLKALRELVDTVGIETTEESPVKLVVILEAHAGGEGDQ